MQCNVMKCNQTIPGGQKAEGGTGLLRKRSAAVSKWKKINNTIKFINISKGRFQERN